MTSIGELRRRTIGELTRPSYSIHSTKMVLLNDNANLFGVNPAVEEVAKTFDFPRLWAYPSESSSDLRERIASRFSVSPEEVIVGNGSDDLLDITSRCFLESGDKMCSPSPTFSMYKFYATLNLGRVCEKILSKDFSLDPDAILAEKAKLNMICQPNNPTAKLFSPTSVRKVLAEAAGVVVLDEAYADFCGSDMLADAMRSERTIDLRTFSKAYGLAGLRVGFAISRKEVIDELRRVRTPFGVNSFSEAVAMTAIDDPAWVKHVVSEVRESVAFLRPKLEAMGFKVYPTDCNFLLCRSPVPSAKLVADLKARGVAIRDCGAFPLLEQHVRITLAPREMLEVLLEKLEELDVGGK